jgi:alpha-tubulin suppressor-like RCC1 family protein
LLQQEQRAAVARPIPGLTDIIDVSIASSHICALRRNGQVFCWGGRLLDENTRSEPVPPTAFWTSPGATQVVVDHGHVCVLDRQRELQCAEALDGKLMPTGATQLRQLLKGARGQIHALRDNGELYTLGGGTPRWLDKLPATDTVGWAIGVNHGCRLTSNGRVACAGDDRQGQLARGTLRGSNVALEITRGRP